MLLQKEDGVTQSIKLKDVVEYKKEPNIKFNPQFDILLREGEVVVNRQLPNTVNYEEIGSFIVLESDSCLATVKAGLITVETHLSDNVQKPSFEIIKIKNLKKIQKKQIIFSKKKEEEKEYYGFTFEDVVKNNIQARTVQTSVNNTTKLEYNIANKGLYAIYDAQVKRIIPFRVVE